MANIITSISNSKNIKAASNAANKVFNSVGNFVDKASKNDKFTKIANKLEPTGANNAFIPMTTLMFAAVILPRVITAANRNPDNKEATRDEIFEILFRDVQTVAIVLFALKSINSLVANFATKATGLPMTNKPYQKLFENTDKGLEGIGKKAQEFIQHPIQKLKIMGKNILDTVHPTDGVRALTNDEFVAEYSNFNSVDEVIKMLDKVESKGGDKEKVFNKIMDDIIEGQKDFIEGNTKKGVVGLKEQELRKPSRSGRETDARREIKRANQFLDELKELKEKGSVGLYDLKDSDASEQIVAFFEKKVGEAPKIEDIKNERLKKIVNFFFSNTDNPLVWSAKKLNALLRTGALAFEATYLGAGLPALNQKRLERKYLKEHPKDDTFTPKEASSNSLINKSIKANEINLYTKFIK